MFGTKVHVSLRNVICTDSAASVGSAPPEESVSERICAKQLSNVTQTPKSKGGQKKDIMQII